MNITKNIPEERICYECNKPKNTERYFYKSNNPIFGFRMHICKECLNEETDLINIMTILKTHDIPFLDGEWMMCRHDIGNYLKTIFSLSQYKNKNWEDSDCCNKGKTEFRSKVTQTLLREIELLTPKLEKYRESEDYGTYKNLINAYREILNLIQSFSKEN